MDGLSEAAKSNKHRAIEAAVDMNKNTLIFLRCSMQARW